MKVKIFYGSVWSKEEKAVEESARFLKMPPSTQNLYFHLGLNADDDGVVEGYNVMMQTGATEDDLKLLVAKGFVTVLNDDLVTYINDWRENNRIRADRKVDSIYKNLLVKMIPDIELQPSRRRADTKKKPGVKRIEDNGRPLDNQRTTNGPHSLGQSRSGQDSLGQVRSSSSVEDEPVDKDDDDDKKEKLLNEIRKTVKEAPTDSEWSSIQLLFKKLSWERLRLVTLGFNSKVAGGEIDRPYPYLLTVLRQKVEENR